MEYLRSTRWLAIAVNQELFLILPHKIIESWVMNFSVAGEHKQKTAATDEFESSLVTADGF